MLAQKKFFPLAISKEELEMAFKEAGYEIVKIKVTPVLEKSTDISNQESYYFVHAHKPCS